MKMQSAAPTATVVGLVFFRRTGPMVRAMGCVGGAHEREHMEVVVLPVLVDPRVSCCRRSGRSDQGERGRGRLGALGQGGLRRC